MFNIKCCKPKTMLMLLTVVCLTYSCKKEASEQIAQPKEINSEDVCREISPQNPDSVGTVLHFTPSCITAMMQDPDYDGWNFNSMIHYHEFDTAGFYTYFISPYYFYENNILCVCVQDNEIALRYAMTFPEDFNYQTYYSQNRTAFISIYSHDYEELFYEGYLNVRNGTFLFTYVNLQLLDDEEKLPPLEHWRDMNLCEKILCGAEFFWDAGFSIAIPGVGGYLVPIANHYAFKFMRKKACN